MLAGRCCWRVVVWPTDGTQPIIKCMLISLGGGSESARPPASEQDDDVCTHQLTNSARGDAIAVIKISERIVSWLINGARQRWWNHATDLEPPEELHGSGKLIRTRRRSPSGDQTKHRRRSAITCIAAFFERMISFIFHHASTNTFQPTSCECGSSLEALIRVKLLKLKSKQPEAGWTGN